MSKDFDSVISMINDDLHCSEVAAFLEVTDKDTKSASINTDESSVETEANYQYSEVFSEVKDVGDKSESVNLDKFAVEVDDDNYHTEIDLLLNVKEVSETESINFVEDNKSESVNTDKSAVEAVIHNQYDTEIDSFLNIEGDKLNSINKDVDNKLQSIKIDDKSVVEPEVDNHYDTEMDSFLNLKEDSKIDSINLNKSVIDTKAENHHFTETVPCMEEMYVNKPKSLFAPFSHKMKPDPEYVRFVAEKTALSPEIASKLIRDRYKLIKESAAWRKEQEQKNRKMRIKSNQLWPNIGYVKDFRTSQLSPEGIKETTEIIKNLSLKCQSEVKDQIPEKEKQSEESSESQDEVIYWHNGLKRFIKLNFGEIKTKAYVSSVEQMKTVIYHHENRVKALRNQQDNEEKRYVLTQSSQKLGNSNCRKFTQTFCDRNGSISSSYVDHI